MNQHLQAVLSAIDAVNAADPSKDENGTPRALLYGRHMTEALDRFAPDAPEALKIAARAQHIERWVIPRSSYPEGRVPYLAWRKDLQKHHAQRTGELMRTAGCGEDEIARVASLLKKERLKFDADAQALEDVICLVFLQHEAEAFIAKHDDGKVRDILAKTAKKMSAAGLAAAGQVKMNDRLARLLTEALSGA